MVSKLMFRYIIINASGGRYYGFEDKLDDAIYAFKIFVN
tara:strand:+ start:38 stop:154 length:117 start_codon:yes stop_codon:yes gene_type:complete